jgi:diguanylate cyclase (GGDEF)-like protein
MRYDLRRTGDVGASGRMGSLSSTWHLLIKHDGKVLACDSSTAAALGIAPDDLPNLTDLIDHSLADELLQKLSAGQVEISSTASVSHSLRDRAGEIVQVQALRLVGHSGPFALVIVRPCQTEPARDAVTGLPDRRAIFPLLESWKAAGQGRINYAVLFLDLDRFKQINDDYGHAVGDQVLMIAADRLARCVRAGDLVVRYGGDEFVMVLQDIGARRDVEPVIERIRGCLAEPIRLESEAFEISVTVGVAVVSGPEVAIEQALDAADRDMYAQKRRRAK